MTFVSASDAKYLGRARAVLFERLAASGRLAITSPDLDEFTQMTIPECRKYVVGREKAMKHIRKLLGSNFKKVVFEGR